MMQTFLVVLGVIYVLVGVVVFILTTNKSDALQGTIESHSPLNTYGFTHKWFTFGIIFLWPVWLLIQDKLPDEKRKGPF
jgi:surface polysaccharide O-acyltransferase-like enzyme